MGSSSHARTSSARALAAAAVGACLASYSSSARADVDFQLTAGVGVAWRRTMPSLTLDAASTAARDIADRKVAIGGSMFSLGGGVDSAVVADDSWTIPLLGFAGYGAIGSYDTLVTSVDGSVARIRPWKTYHVDVLLPGVGYRMIKRRYMFSATLRGGLVSLHTDGSVAGGATETPFELSATSPLVQAELQACRRLDPVTRVCLQVAPRIYDFGFMNGATFGLRVEWGR